MTHVARPAGAVASALPVVYQACGGAVNMEDAVVALQEQQQALQEQQQALLLLAKETAKQREETEHRTRTISARWA